MNQDIVDSFLPLGQHTKSTYDANHLPLSVINGSGTLTWERDAFGLVTNHTDLMGKVHHSEYDYAKRIKQETSMGAPRFHMFANSKALYLQDLGGEVRDPQKRYPMQYQQCLAAMVPQQGILYNYQHGLLAGTTDTGVGLYTYNKYDSEGRRYDTLIKNNYEIVVDHIAESYDALGRPALISNQRKLLSNFYAYTAEEIMYDGADNRKRIDVVLDAPGYCQACRYPLQVQRFYNSYDAADRIKVQNGVLLPNSEISISPITGIEYAYLNNLRSVEARSGIFVNLGYDADGLLQETHATTGLNTAITYHPTGVLQNYREGNKSHYIFDILAET